MSNTTQELQTAFNTYLEENKKFEEKGNGAAGTRARKALQELKVLAHKRRDEIQEVKNSK